MRRTAYADVCAAWRDSDANIALGDEIRLVERQFRAYEAEHAAK